MSTNFHESPFDEATILKLGIFRDYLETWLPTFLNQVPGHKWNGKINIFDFFCGPGLDKNGRPGSPLVIIEKCQEFLYQIQENNKEINIYFSDSNKSKIESLQQVLSTKKIPKEIKISAERIGFNDQFEKMNPVMQGAANLLFIDQCGIKEVNEEIFRKLTSLHGTDFIFFIASSYVQRFHSTPEFKSHLNGIERTFSQKASSAFAHRSIAGWYRDKIPTNKKYFLGSFSIKKNRNTNGIIFGSNHHLGLDKFIRICWKYDKHRGEANFDIDGEAFPVDEPTIDLFSDHFVASKLAEFQGDIERKILEGIFTKDSEIYIYALQEGFIPSKHVGPVIKGLLKDKKISLKGGNLRMSKESIQSPREFKIL